MNYLNRRRFIAALTATGVGSSFLSAVNFISCQTAPANFTAPVLGGLLHFAILDDVANLAIQANLVKGDAKTFIAADFNLPIPANLSRMGTLVPFEKNQLEALLQSEISVLNTMRKKHYTEQNVLELPENDETNSGLIIEKSERKIALILGWFMAAGIRELPHSSIDTSKSGKLSEESLYQDMYVLKKMCGTSVKAKTAEMEDLFKGFNPRMIGRTHTLTPDYDDGENWTVRISDWRDDTMKLMTRYAEVYTNPDPEKVHEYIEKINFYNDKNDLIKLTHTARRGEAIDADLVEKAIISADSHSLYSQAVTSGLQELLQAAKLIA